MNDNRGRGPSTNEGRIERNASRPYENKPAQDDARKKISGVQDDTRNRVNGALNKKK